MAVVEGFVAAHRAGRETDPFGIQPGTLGRIVRHGGTRVGQPHRRWVVPQISRMRQPAQEGRMVHGKPAPRRVGLGQVEHREAGRPPRRQALGQPGRREVSIEA